MEIEKEAEDQSKSDSERWEINVNVRDEENMDDAFGQEAAEQMNLATNLETAGGGLQVSSPESETLRLGNLPLLAPIPMWRIPARSYDDTAANVTSDDLQEKSDSKLNSSMEEDLEPEEDDIENLMPPPL